VLIQTEVGKAGQVAQAIGGIDGVQRVEDVAGPTMSSPGSRRPAWTNWAGWSPASRPWTGSPARARTRLARPCRGRATGGAAPRVLPRHRAFRAGPPIPEFQELIGRFAVATDPGALGGAHHRHRPVRLPPGTECVSLRAAGAVCGQPACRLRRLRRHLRAGRDRGVTATLVATVGTSRLATVWPGGCDAASAGRCDRHRLRRRHGGDCSERELLRHWVVEPAGRIRRVRPDPRGWLARRPACRGRRTVRAAPWAVALPRGRGWPSDRATKTTRDDSRRQNRCSIRLAGAAE
jgi:hypothetical protein